jgi:hypothetical protein
VGTNPIHYAYQWQRGGLSVAGATGSTYPLSASDLGDSVDAVVTASNAAGSRSATSASTAIVTAELVPPLSPTPTVGGLSPGSGPEAGGTSVSIAGANFGDVTAVKFGAANAAAYTVLSASSITAVAPPGRGTVDVTVTTSAGTSASGSLDRFSYQALPPANSGLPTITGIAEEGKTLTEAPATWTGATSFSVQWQRCDSEGNNCSSILGANGQTYTLTASDVGRTIRVEEAASNASGLTSATSEPTHVVVLPASPRTGLAGFSFIGSIDTMKLSKDHASGGFTAGDAQAVDLAATMATTHITDNAPLEYPATMVGWASRIHEDGKHVWFRLAAFNGGAMAHADAPKANNYQPPYDGYPGFASGYLTKLHEIMLANPGLVKPGDILDGDAEPENSGWWAANYGCGVQQGCTPCPDIAHMTSASYPCSPISEFNRFLVVMTEQEDADLASLGLTPCATLTSTDCVLTKVHSTDPGTATHQLSTETVGQMGNLITVDAYPDQKTREPQVAASAWKAALESWEDTWKAKGVSVSILVGEWGYSNAINVTDSQQEAVVKAETEVFPTIPYLAGTNYWVGPGNSKAGGFTNIFVQEAGLWKLRPAASDVSALYATMNP